MTESVPELGGSWARYHGRPIDRADVKARVDLPGYRRSELSVITLDVAGSNGFPCSRKYPRDEVNKQYLINAVLKYCM
jgi:hypothetical protein